MMVTLPVEPDRYEPFPSLLELPAYLLRKVPASRRRQVVIGGVVLVVAVVAAAAVVVPQLRSQQHDAAAREARQTAAAQAALRARYAREARPIEGRGPAAGGRDGAAALSVRRELVAGLQTAVLADARDRARRGELHAQYRSTTCYGYPKQVHEHPPADDLARATAVFECIAVAKSVARDTRTTSGSLIGQPYRARVDFTHGRYAFCKIVQRPGELSIQRESVLKVPQACGGKP
jgi:type II secretory pathway pseudopilin PulG